MKLKVSIIIPVFNEESTVVELLKKVRAQSHEQVEFEVIVIDDGSTDSTWNKILKEVQDKSVVALKNDKNLGIFESWKKGINLSTN